MDLTPLRIRRATLDDLDALATANLAMALESEDKRLDGNLLRAGLQALLEDRDRGVYYLAERGGRYAGQLMITTEWSDWRNGWFWWIQSVYVAPEERGAGVSGAA